MSTSREDDRVLVVEEPDGHEALTRGLEIAGYHVDFAGDGETALLMAAARSPAVALIDLNARIIDGRTLARSLRVMLDGEVRLIAMANRNEREERSLAAGFDAHLVKPVSANLVHHTLRRLFAR